MIITGEDKVKAFKELLMEDIDIINGKGHEEQMEEIGLEEVKAAPKYKVGDRVKYYDRDKTKRNGNVLAIEQTDVYEWNEDKERKFIYTLSSTDCLRYEEDIIGLCK